MDRTTRGEDLDRQVKESIGQLEEQLLQGQPQAFLDALEWWAHLRQYSFGNCRLIWMQKPDAIQCAGFKFWEPLGFHVRSGEKALWIKAPRMKKLPDPDTGELVERLVGWIAVPVFCISQCQEWPEKQPPDPFTPATEADWEHLYTCWSRRLTTLYDIPVKEVEMGGLVYGMASQRAIRINARHSYGVKAPVMLHELCHIVAGHPTVEGHEKWMRQERELQVEAATFVLCRMVGGNHPNAANYLRNYKVEPGQLIEHLEIIGAIVRDVRHMLEFSDLGKAVEQAQAA